MGDIVIKWYKCLCLLVVISIIASCSLITPMTTSSTSIKELSLVKTTAELVTSYYTDKTATDHAVSFVLGKDCKMTRVAKREKICEEIKPKVYEDKNKNKISMVGLNSEHMIVPIIEQKHSTSQISMLANTKKVEGIKKNNIELVESKVEAGSGSLPIEEIPSMAITFSSSTLKPSELSALFKRASFPILGYIHGNKFRIDLKAIPAELTKVCTNIFNEVLR